MNLLIDQQEEVLLNLGYYPEERTLYKRLGESFPVGYYQKILEILEDLTTIDASLKDARSKSMAIEVGSELKVNYFQHIKHLRTDGSDLLKQLSTITSLPIRFNRFKNQSNNAVHYQ